MGLCIELEFYFFSLYCMSVCLAEPETKSPQSERQQKKRGSAPLSPQHASIWTSSLLDWHNFPTAFHVTTYIVLQQKSPRRSQSRAARSYYRPVSVCAHIRMFLRRRAMNERPEHEKLSWKLGTRERFCTSLLELGHTASPPRSIVLLR